MEHKLEYFGFELERDVEVIEDFTPEVAPRARKVLADAMARGQARHLSVKKNRAAVEEIRQTYRRSGGQTPRFNFADLIAWYESQMADVSSMNDFRNARFVLDRNEIVPREVREKYANLPDSVVIRDREVDIEYDVEERDGGLTGIARLRLPEKIARTLAEEEVPKLDRPVRFVVIRGQRGAIRADTLDELQEMLAQPWSPDEVDDSPRSDEESRQEQHARDLAGKHRRGRRDSTRRGDNRPGKGAPRGRGGPPGRGGPSGRGKGSRRKFRGR
jgi:ATP-dependent helicase HrpA